MQKPSVLTGSENLFRDDFRELIDARIGFVGNHTSRLADGNPTYLALFQSPRTKVVRLFSPEHGAFGIEDHENIGDDIDSITRLPIFSLYGANRKPTPEMLSGLDALVFEIQDVGARFYTYASTMLLCLEAAFEAGVKMIVLDRPNPINGVSCEGPLADFDRLSFVACHTIPIRHGLTLGELAILVAAEKGYNDALVVIPCLGWQREMWWDQTGLEWINPSPAMRSLNTAAVYPGTCLLEQTNVSVGRGTHAPFLTIGAPWIDGQKCVDAIKQFDLPGVVVTRTSFTPSFSKFEGEQCGGIEIEVVDRANLNSVMLGLTLITTLRGLYTEQFDLTGVQKLLANRSVYDMLLDIRSVDEIVATYQPSLRQWTIDRQKCLLYEST